MAARVVSNSILRFTDLRTIDDVEFWDLVDDVKIPEQEDDIVYQVQGEDRIDNLATRFYGDPVLWWLIAQVNGLEILPTDLQPGSFITIPSPRFVRQNLLSLARQ